MLGKLIQEHTDLSARVPLLLARQDALEAELMRRLPLRELKALWESYDAIETSNHVISGEMVHAELNRRGHGAYCAV